MVKEDEEHLIFNIDLDFNSHRQQKMFERNPVAYLVKKLTSSEVSLQRLSPADRELFHRAKLKEVDSFIKNEAVRRCLSQEEVAEAYGSGRILKARWVLTWKSIPPDERDEAREDQQTNAKTVVNHDNTKKAKARMCSWATSIHHYVVSTHPHPSNQRWVGIFSMFSLLLTSGSCRG